jgi:hypothetical protein
MWSSLQCFSVANPFWSLEVDSQDSEVSASYFLAFSKPMADGWYEALKLQIFLEGVKICFQVLTCASATTTGTQTTYIFY